MQETISIRTSGKGLYEITGKVEKIVDRANVTSGLCNLFIHHTSGSLLIQENAAPSAQRDLEEFFSRIAPEGENWYTHVSEGPDDMPSHIRSALTNTSETIPINQGTLGLGTWQGIFLFEHRSAGKNRNITVSVQPLS